VSELEEIAEEVYDKSIAQIVWPGTRTLVQAHLAAGEQVWLVTAAPVEMAGVIAARLGMNGALGTTAEHHDGLYTGRLRGELLHGTAKADAIGALAVVEGLDLARCHAYSDSYNDLPMLSLVGRPAVINPDRRLRRHADQQGWRVRDFRRGRRAARFGLLGAGGATGAWAAGRAVRRLLRR
jgi:HAD superfamily hydrolase (TIGR01490 family)